MNVKSRYPLVTLGEVLTPECDEIIVNPEGNYRMAGIYSFGRGLFARETVRGTETRYAKLTRLHYGQLVISRLNAWEGAIDIVPAALNECTVSQEYPTFRADDDRLDKGFLWAITRWPTYWDSLVPRGSMVRRKRVTTGAVLATKVPLPDLQEQRRVVGRIQRMLERISGTAVRHERMGELLTGVTSATFTELSNGPTSELRGALMLAPDEIVVDPEATYRVAGVYSFGRGLLHRSTISGADTKYPVFNRLRAGHFVYSRLRSWEGALGVVPPEFDGFVASPEYPTFEIDGDVADPGYLAFMCRWPGFWDLLSPRGSMVRRKRVKPEALLSVKVPFPALAEQRRLGAMGELLRQIERKLDASASTVKSLTPAIVGAGLRGEL